MVLKNFFTRDKMYAFLIHLAISLVIFLILLYFIVVHWYPQPLFGSDGGWQGIRLIAAVDIVLGPLLTLIVFRKNKPRLKLDMSIIAAIQVGALISGVWIVYGEHPVLITFDEDRLHPIPAYQVIEAGITLDSLEQYGPNKPPIAYIDLPDEPLALSELFAKARREGRPIFLHGERYQPINEKNIDRILAHAIDLPAYVADRPEDKETYRQFAEKNPHALQDYAFLELRSRYAWFVAVFDVKTYQLVDVLDIPPPSMTQKVIKIKGPNPLAGSKPQPPSKEASASSPGG